MKIIFILFILFSTVSIASAPISTVRVSINTTEDGIRYETYKVKCDNGRETHINSRGDFPKKQWCVGIEEEETCKTGRTQKVKVAKLACK